MSGHKAAAAESVNASNRDATRQADSGALRQLGFPDAPHSIDVRVRFRRYRRDATVWLGRTAMAPPFAVLRAAARTTGDVHLTAVGGQRFVAARPMLTSGLYWRAAGAASGSATNTSMRRFLARPSGVLLSAIGSCSPRPSTAIRLLATPRAAR